MAKQLNGIFREWMKCTQPDNRRMSIIWGHCLVHLSHPQFSGNVIHTSRISKIAGHGTFSIVETRNSHYVLLGPELKPPAGVLVDPREYVLAHLAPARGTDSLVNAAVNANPDCPKCRGAGIYGLDDSHTAICDLCCKHNVGWWQLEGCYGADNGKWACKAGCGLIVDRPPPELEFLPRAKM